MKDGSYKKVVEIKRIFQFLLLAAILYLLVSVKAAAQGNLQENIIFDSEKKAKSGNLERIIYQYDNINTFIPIKRREWFRSGIPIFDEQSGIADPAMQFRADKRGKLVWYNPWQQVAIKEIFPNKDVNTRTGTMTNVLVLKRIKDSNHPPEPSVFEWWSGITTSLPTSNYNHSETKSIEMLIKGENGRIHFDLGLISEDAIPNGTLDTEDIAGGRANGILDAGEDVGLDGVPGKDGTNSVEKFDDDWDYAFKSDDYSSINGTEGNGSGSKIDVDFIPDTEDINRNGVLDTRNDYFKYSFTLGRDHPDFSEFVVGGQDNPYGWRFYRIPIDRASKKIGNPDLARIEFVRIWVEGLDIGNEIDIASIVLAEFKRDIDEYFIVDYKLFQCYPNPFNSTVMIDYFLPVTSDVKLEIYNLLGQKVRTLVNENQLSGTYRSAWDGRNNFGNNVASGIYFYKLQTGNFVDIKKMVLLR